MTFVAGQVLTASQMNALEAATMPAGSITSYAGVTVPDNWLLCDGSAISRTTYSTLFATFSTSFTAATTTNASTTVSGLSGMSSTVHVGWGIAGTNIPSGAKISSVTNATTVVISAAATGTASGTANIAISPYGFTGAANTTTFNLPNLAGRIPVGIDTTQSEFNILGETGGAKTHTLTTSEMPSHTHTQDPHLHRVSENLTLLQTNVSGVQGIQTTGTGAGYDTQNTTATNRDTGGGGAHNNLQPYITIRYIIKI